MNGKLAQPAYCEIIGLSLIGTQAYLKNKDFGERCHAGYSKHLLVREVVTT